MFSTILVIRTKVIISIFVLFFVMISVSFISRSILSTKKSKIIRQQVFHYSRSDDNIRNNIEVDVQSSGRILLEEEPGLNSGLGKEKVIYYDNDIIVVDKPAYAQTAPGFTDKDSVATRIADMFKIERIDHMIVHRLDYATSGLIIYARNVESLKNLHTQFRLNKIYKVYSAIVNGRITSSLEGEINLPLGKDKERGPPFCKVIPIIHNDNDNKEIKKNTSISRIEKSKESLTHWEVYQLGKELSHLILKPKTGRTHQLRVHLSSIGHPILGDLFYSPPAVYNKSRRLLLHAQEIRLHHPISGEPCRFYSPAPFSINEYE